MTPNKLLSKSFSSSGSERKQSAPLLGYHEGKQKAQKIKADHSSSSSNSSDSSSRSSSSTSSNSSTERKRRKKELKRKLAKQQKKEAKAKKKALRKEKKAKRKQEKLAKKLAKRKLKEQSKKEKEQSKDATAIRNAAPEQGEPPGLLDCGIPLDLMNRKAMAPETREEYEARQSILRRVVDPETGRTRLIKGDGEIIEECVTRDRHKEINRQATAGDGAEFQRKTLGRNVR
uniref:ADP-ribosylation factor-like protein 6-interacting protein 4 n=1 Tax=Anopheles stephensi TaxID=30069 RepID=A0A182YM44_ANOST